MNLWLKLLDWFVFWDLRSLITSGADFMNLVIYNMVSSSKIFVSTCYRILSPTVRDFMDTIYLFILGWYDLQAYDYLEANLY